MEVMILQNPDGDITLFKDLEALKKYLHKNYDNDDTLSYELSETDGEVTFTEVDFDDEEGSEWTEYFWYQEVVE